MKGALLQPAATESHAFGAKLSNDRIERILAGSEPAKQLVDNTCVAGIRHNNALAATPFGVSVADRVKARVNARPRLRHRSLASHLRVVTYEILRHLYLNALHE